MSQGWKQYQNNGSVLPSSLIFHGKRTLTEAQYLNRQGTFPALVADVHTHSVKLPILFRHSLFGIEGLLVQPDISRVPVQNRFIFRVRIFDIMLCEAKESDATVVIFTKDLAPNGATENGDAVVGYGMYVMTARSARDASFLCQVVIRWLDQWSSQGQVIVSQNLSHAQFDNPAVKQIAARHGKKAVQVLIRWLLTKWARHEGSIRLPRTLSPLQIASVYGTDEWQFSKAELFALEALTRDFRYQPLVVKQPPSQFARSESLSPNNRPQAPKASSQFTKNQGKNRATSTAGAQHHQRRTNSASYVPPPTTIPETQEQEQEEDHKPRKSRPGRRMSFQVAKTETAITALYSAAVNTKEELIQTNSFTRKAITEIAKTFERKFPSGIIPKAEFQKIAGKLLKDQIFDIADYTNLLYEVFDIGHLDEIRLKDYRMFLASNGSDKTDERLRAIFEAFAEGYSKGNRLLNTDNLASVILLANALHPEGAESVSQFGLTPAGLAEMMMIELGGTFEDGGGMTMEEFVTAVGQNEMLSDALVVSAKDKTLNRNANTDLSNGSLASFSTQHPDQNDWGGFEGFE
eukprot:m.180093 g.180093  ORF g.180093 m.180093 type:complete len:576 (-) comp32004_c0_seq2:211-1938(-)